MAPLHRGRGERHVLIVVVRFGDSGTADVRLKFGPIGLILQSSVCKGLRVFAAAVYSPSVAIRILSLI